MCLHVAQGQNMCLHVALPCIPFNLICDMTTFKKKILTPPEGVGKDRIRACMVLYGPFPLIFEMTFQKKM